jgi:hypothetical protein
MNKTEQCFCKSYYDDKLQDCTCGKCDLTERIVKTDKGYFFDTEAGHYIKLSKEICDVIDAPTSDFQDEGERWETIGDLLNELLTPKQSVSGEVEDIRGFNKEWGSSPKVIAFKEYQKRLEEAGQMKSTPKEEYDFYRGWEYACDYLIQPHNAVDKTVENRTVTKEEALIKRIDFNYVDGEYEFNIRPHAMYEA